jgi:hypothetical protein
MLDIHSYGVLMFYMWYMKRLLFYPYLYSGLVGMIISLDPPSSPLWMDLSSNIGSLPVVGLLVEPFPMFKIFPVAMGISSVVALN